MEREGFTGTPNIFLVAYANNKLDNLKIDIHNNSLYRNVKYEKRYDCSSNIIFDSKIVETCDSNNDPDENCCSIISRFYFGDEIIKVHSMSYSLKPYLNIPMKFLIKGFHMFLYYIYSHINLIYF